MRTVIVLGILALLLAVLVIFDFSAGDPAEREEQAQAVLADWVADDDLRRLLIRRAETTVELVESEGAWRLSEPFDDRADGGRVSTLIAALRNLRAERRFEAQGAELAELGLDPATIELELETAGGARFELAIGREMPLDRLWSLRLGAEVFLARGFFIADLEREVDHWRDRSLIGPGFGDPVELSVGEALRLERRGDDWWLTRPFEDLASDRVAADLVGVLSGATITAFDVDPVDVTTVVLLRGTTGELHLELGADNGGERPLLHPARGWLQVRLPRPLEVDPEGLRCRKLWCFDAWEAEALEHDGQRLQRGAEPGDWELAQAEASSGVDGGAVYELWQGLAGLQAAPITGPWDPAGAASIILELEGLETIELRRVESGIVAVDGRPDLFEVDPDRLDELLDFGTLAGAKTDQ